MYLATHPDGRWTDFTSPLYRDSNGFDRDELQPVFHRLYYGLAEELVVET